MANQLDGRMIRKTISNSSRFSSLSPKAAVLFAMLIPHYNSHGKINGGVGYIKDEVCPKIPYLTYVNIPKLLKEISEKTNVKWFEYDGRYWIHSLNFLTEHQKLRLDRLGADLVPSYSGVSPELVRSYSGVSPELVHIEEEVEVEVEEEEEGKSGVTPEIPNQEMEHPYKEYLEILSQIPKYPFDIKTDLPFLKEKEKDYSTIDILSMLKAWKTYLLDVPLNGKSRPRAQLHNQFELAVKYNKHKKIQKEPQAPSTLDKIKAAQRETEASAG